MMRGDILLILGHGVIIKSRSTLPPCEGMPCLALSSYSLNMVTTLHRCAPVILVGIYIRGPSGMRSVFPIQVYVNLVIASPLAKYHIYFVDSIMVLYCRPHSQVVHVPVWSSQYARGPQKGNSWKFTPPHFPKEGSKWMYEEVSLLSEPFRRKHFDVFWHFLSFPLNSNIFPNLLLN